VSNSHSKTPQALPNGGRRQQARCQSKIKGGSVESSFTFVWNLWKERNRRIFENEHKTVQQVALVTKEEIMQRCRAVSFDG
jgi:hypothetical protein